MWLKSACLCSCTNGTVEDLELSSDGIPATSDGRYAVTGGKTWGAELHRHVLCMAASVKKGWRECNGH